MMGCVGAAEAARSLQSPERSANYATGCVWLMTGRGKFSRFASGRSCWLLCLFVGGFDFLRLRVPGRSNEGEKYVLAYR